MALFGQNKNFDGDVWFSSDYFEARDRFRLAAKEFGLDCGTFPVPSDSGLDLTIDTASIGPEGGKTIVLTSGIHGVEGYFGSAVQLFTMESLANQLPEGVRLVLIHALNPFGFAKNRRFDESNIDLNRNFLLTGERYEGVSGGYEKLKEFLNPEGMTPKSEWFYWKAVYYILKMGMPALRQAVAGGQYKYPKGIFFGGAEPSSSLKVIKANARNWVGSAQEIVHIDFHTGLGKFGDHRLLVSDEEYSHHREWYENVFGKEKLDPLTTQSETAYKITGLFGSWLQKLFPESEYRFVGAEFGTYHPVRVMRSIRNENRSFHFDPADSSERNRATEELIECFCPKSSKWRKKVLEDSLVLVFNAIKPQGDRMNGIERLQKKME